ncbi:spore protease YyaC [Paenibacillus pinistramenti]|uniref:spore protease YyaC n=1 Tax=Paenibacillus pinistramenti TaxID=1768003 RepID=UPI00110977D6|nr:spore protease YyaC [Paenibacillus pinistramenti]
MAINRYPGERGFAAAPRTRVNGAGLESFFRGIAARHPLESTQFICIGTDRSAGDALGPLTGSRLAQYGISSVIGTMPEPCDADTLASRLLELRDDRIVIAVDACLGSELSVGAYLAAHGPLQPAESVGLRFPPVGDYSIAAVVNRKGPKPYQSLQTASLHLVMTMADEIAAAAAAGFGLK